MTLNPWECHYMLLRNQDQINKINLIKIEITGSKNKKFPKLSQQLLNFDTPIRSLCRKAGGYINTLDRLHKTIGQTIANAIIKFV